MGLFEGKKGVILGVFTDHSLAWAIAQQVLAGGAECGFSHMPDKPDDERQKNRRRVSQLAPKAKFLCPMDVTKDEDITHFMAQTKEQFGKIDFLVHAIAFAPPADLKAGTLNTSREGFKTAMAISCYLLRRRKSGARLQRDGRVQSGFGLHREIPVVRLGRRSGARECRECRAGKNGFGQRGWRG